MAGDGVRAGHQTSRDPACFLRQGPLEGRLFSRKSRAFVGNGAAREDRGRGSSRSPASEELLMLSGKWRGGDRLRPLRRVPSPANV
jgi:hypothetical protein